MRVRIKKIEDEGWRQVVWVVDHSGKEYWRTHKETHIPLQIGERGWMPFREVHPMTKQATVKEAI